MAGLRHQSTSEVLGLLTSLSHLTLLLLLHRLLGTTFLLGGLLLQHVIENCGECMGGGRRRLRRPQLTAHATKKCPEIAGAMAETLCGHAQGTPGAILDRPPPRGEHCAATHAVVRTEPSPGDKRLGRWPCMHMEAHCGQDGVDRQGLEARPLREVDAGDPGPMAAQIKGRCVALRLPMGRRWWGEGGASRSTWESKVPRTRSIS